MEGWKKISLILCGFGLLKELRPSESFITEYFIGFKNITAGEVIHDLYPIGTYTILIASLIAFLVTDFLRYRPILIFQAISFVTCWITLIWGKSYFLMQFVQVLYGLSLSADVAYYTYIYAQVDKENYQRVTSYTYTAVLAGKFLASLSAQILVSFNFMNFHELIYITLSTSIGAFLVSIYLPSVQTSIYFNRLTTTNEIENMNVQVVSLLDVQQQPKIYSIQKIYTERLKKAYQFLWIDFKHAYSNIYVFKWSIWWAIAYAGNLQVVYYTQPLWERVDSFTETNIYNGAVGAIQCLLSALLTVGVGHLKISWSKWGESLLCLISILQGFILIWMSQTKSLYIAYGTYMMFRILYQLVITIASSEVAHGITKDSCGLIFGINTFIAFIIQTILTIVVTDKRGLALDERSQFVVYGSYFLVLGIIFFFIVICTLVQTRCYSSGKILSQVKVHLDEYIQPENYIVEKSHNAL